jgi:hypothetical protein
VVYLDDFGTWGEGGGNHNFDVIFCLKFFAGLVFKNVAGLIPMN